VRRIILTPLLAAGVLSLAACNSTGTQAGASSPTSSAGSAIAAVPSLPTPTPAPVSSTPAPSSVAAPPVAATFVPFAMPKLVGLDLQSAQNQVQTHSILYSRSHDLRGSRHQILDSDWVVCSQNIPAGQMVTSDIEGGIDFGVVKRSETCP
jgi:hypothetical protein